MIAPGEAVGRLTNLRTNEDVRRLGACLLGMLVLALMTGPSGSSGAPVSGFSGSLLHPRVFVFLALGVGLFAVITARRRYAEPVRDVSQRLSELRGRLVGSGRRRSLLFLAALAFAIFYPLTISSFWQEVLVDQIGVFVLLAIGLNVVVGFAGLLDLGYIAFYAIGAYSDAYWTGALSIAPPFHVNAFFAIPFAVLAAMLAGVVLGAPT